MTDDDSEQARLADVVDVDGSAVDGDDSPVDAGDTPVDVDDTSADVGDIPVDVGDTPVDVSDSAADVAETVELGVALLAHLEDDELPLAEAVDRIETVTADPALTREILDTAEMRGVIDREDGIVRPRSGAFVSFERDVVRREGEFTCRRCGASLSTGHFVRFDAGEHGPFGSSCIRKVTGRE